MFGAELAPVLITAIVGLGQAIVAWGLYVWGRWVARRQGGVWWRRAAVMPLVSVGLALLGVGLTSVLLTRSFGAVEGVDPSHKAQVLSDGIAKAMWPAAIAMPISWLLFAGSIALFAYGTLRRPSEGGSFEAPPQ